MYIAQGGKTSKLYSLVDRVESHFGSEIVTLRSQGYSNMFLFKCYAKQYLVLDECDDDLNQHLSDISKIVIEEVKALPSNPNQYKREIDAESLKSECSSTVLRLLSAFSPRLDETPTAFLISSMITSV